MDYTKHIGSRILVGQNKEITEFQILEVSISKRWIKVMDQYGKKKWLSHESLDKDMLEVLKPKPPRKPTCQNIQIGDIVVVKGSVDEVMTVKNIKDGQFHLWEMRPMSSTRSLPVHQEHRLIKIAENMDEYYFGDEDKKENQNKSVSPV